MAPNVPNAVPTGVLFEGDEPVIAPTTVKEQSPPKKAYQRKIVWRNVILFIYLHLAALYGLYLTLTSAKLITTIFAILGYEISGLGITAGAHRLWAHRSYKAKWPMRVFLMICNCMAFQNDILEWARDHRVHHKFSETDADPHNAKRGFFFSHMGWLLVRKHPDVLEKGKSIDLSDLKADKIVMFQRKYYLILMPILCFVLPTIIPVFCWNETWLNAFFVGTIARYTLILNATWLVNSAAHMWGGKPYDKNIGPVENLGVAIGALGEGWHNFHHVFPWDYKAAELGNYRVNFTTAFIDTCARLGLAYDLKTVPQSLIQKRVERTGDGSHEIWGWDDKDMLAEERDEVKQQKVQ